MLNNYTNTFPLQKSSSLSPFQREINMGFNNIAVFKVCFLLLIILLLGVTTNATQGLLSSHHDDDDPYYSKSSTTLMEPCCDDCVCTKSQDQSPICHCNDLKQGGCHSACKSCSCPYFIRMIPICICLDITNFCYKHC